MAYITKYSAYRITKKLDNIDLLPISSESESYYKRPIGILSDDDVKRLLVYKLLMQYPERFIKTYYKKVSISNNYVFENLPCFHKSNDCDRLKADFQSIIIPRSIRNRESYWIEDFKTWANTNKDLFEKDIEAFKAKGAIKFGIHISEFELVLKKNSGIEYQKNYSLTELDEIFETILAKAKTYYYESQKNRIIIKNFRNKMFLRKDIYNIKFNNTGYLEKDIKEVLNHCYYEFIELLIYYLQEYLRVSLNPNLEFTGNLLEQLGFDNCQKCYFDYVRTINKDNSFEIVSGNRGSDSYTYDIHEVYRTIVEVEFDSALSDIFE